MSQYTFSFLRSEYDRIPHQLKKELDSIVSGSGADEETKKLITAVCDSVCKAVSDLGMYAQDQLKIP